MARAFVGIYDKDGNQIDEVPMGQNGVTGAQTDNEYQKVYRGYDAQGNSYYTATMPESSASVMLDKDTGKINISAPQAVLDDPSFGEIFDEKILQQYSSAYQRNQDYKVPDPFETGDESKDVTIPELIEKYNQEIKKYVKAINDEKAERRQIAEGEIGYSNRNDIANRLTRNDMIIMGTNAMGEGANDDSLIAIPKSMYADVNFLDSFDADAGTVKKGEFREKVFSLKNKDEKYIDSLYNRLEQYFEEDDFEDTEEYARATALNSFILQNDPDADPGQIANYVTSNLAKGAGSSLRTTILGIGNLLGTILSLGGNLPGPARILKQLSEFGLKEEERVQKEAEKWIGRMSTAGATALQVGGVGEKLAEVLLSGGLAGAAAKGAVAASAATRAAKVAEEASVAAEAARLATGVDAALASTTALEAANIAKTAVNISRNAKILGNMADLAAQTVTEAVISDPVVFSKVLQGQQSEGVQPATQQDAYGYLLETAAWNIGGWGAFSVAAKGVKFFGKTKAGRYTNAVAQKYLNKVSVATGSLGEKILKVRYGDDWLNGSRSSTKNQARKYNYELRQAQKNVAQQKIGSVFNENVGKNVRQQEENIIKLMEVHNSTDAVQRGARAYIQRMLNKVINPVLSGYEQKLRNVGSEITKLERKAGLSTRRKKFRVRDKGVDRVFSKQSANYLGARTELDVLANVKKVKGSLSEAQAKGKEILEKKLAEAKKALPKEIQKQLDEYLTWDRKFYAEYNNIRMREGSLNAKQIEELRAEGYWGENGELYRPAYRVDPDKETMLVRNDGRIARDNDTSTEQYVWGSDKDFMDPEIARYMYMGDAGATYNATRYIEAISAIPSSKAHVVYDAEEVARAQRMKNVRKPLGARIKSVANGVFKSGAISTGESAKRTLRLQKMRAAYVAQQGKTVSSHLKLNRASTQKIKVTLSERRAAIDTMTASQTDEVMSDVGIELSRMQSDEGFEILYNSMDRNTQKLIREKMGNVAGILYPAETTQPLQRAIARAGNQEAAETTGFIKSAPYVTAENYNKLARMDPSFIPSVKKSYIKGNKDLRDSDRITKLVEDEKRAKLVAEREGSYKDNLAELQRLGKVGKEAGDQEAILKEFDEGIDEYLELVYQDKKVSGAIDDIIEQSGTTDKEAAREYIVLEEMLRDDSQELRELRQVARDEFRGDSEAQKASDLFERTFLNKVEDRRNVARQKLADENSSLVDRKSWMEEIRKLDKDITGKLSEPGYVSVPNAKGEMEVWEVDPIAADLYKYATRQENMSRTARFFNETSKIFRLGTTGLNLMSFVNQSFRDFGNLWLTSGSYHLVNLSRADMVNQMGQEIANWYLREEPEIYEQLAKLAERQGKTVEKVAVERELAIGAETSTQATETALLKTVGDARTINRINKGEMAVTNTWIDRAVDALGTPNEMRERYFRNIVYADSLNQALKRGYSLKSARIQAEFMMNNATTNFSRQLVHLQALQRTVPYIGAAVNGTKSFYRILSVDPVGVMSRFMGGFVIPVMAFTGLALADPEARKKYEQLSEYEKDNNIIINVNGQLMKIPIPQEIGSLVKPWQHLVEKMHDANRHDFWELMLNDALGISPMDITGFYDLDQDAMENPNTWDRLYNGATQLVWGQMSPPPVKAAYMAITGKDPYTGKFIDTSYQYYDSESGQVVTMDSSTSAFAQAITKQFGGSAGVLAAVVNALVGRTGMDVIDSLTSAVQYGTSGGAEGSLTTLFERAGEAISRPITVADYDRTKTAWNREISALYREKESIVNSEKYKKIEQAINQETDPDKLKSLKAQRQDMLDPWYDKTKVAIDKLQDNFGGTIDRYRMASLISLLNLHEDSGGIGPVGRAANDELYYEGRDEAIRTLVSMGADETGDRSMLGYMTSVRKNDGSEHTEVKFYKPLEILAMQNAWYNNRSVSRAYVQELLEDGDTDYTQEIKQVKKLRQQIYDKGKLSQADYSNITALELEWNARVMTALAPYIERVTPEAAINDEEVMEYLDDLILIPSEFKKDKRGYYVTDKSLAGGSANDAYIKSYIRSIFEINNTGYSSGKNYSGRQTLGG